MGGARTKGCRGTELRVSQWCSRGKKTGWSGAGVVPRKGLLCLPVGPFLDVTQKAQKLLPLERQKARKSSFGS